MRGGEGGGRVEGGRDEKWKGKRGGEKEEVKRKEG